MEVGSGSNVAGIAAIFKNGVSNIYYEEFNGDGLTVQNNFVYIINQNILNCHVWPT